jgi:uncharacterized protein YndB with AHSA1/START domain
MARVKQSTQTKELIIARILDVPRELVWKAWTEPERMKRWWGPKAFTTPVVEIDLRVGGKSFSCMRSPEGKDYCDIGVYQEIIKPRRLVVTDSFADEKGNVVPASYYGMSRDWPMELLVTVSFEEWDGKTKLKLKHGNVASISAEDFEGMKQGWSESFDKLAGYLEKEHKTLNFD